MKSNYKTVRIASTLLFALCFICCKKFVQIAPPVTQLVTSSVFNNATTATSAQTNIYAQMANNGESWNLSENCGLLSDELTNYSTNPVQQQFYTNAMTSTSNSGRWSIAYNYIYQANAIIAALENNSNITPIIRQQLTGEAKFIRAFWHFYLTNCYGDIPLVTSIDYTINGNISRAQQAQVYQQIIADLKDAENLLNSGFVDASDTAVYPIISAERVRPTKSAAAALLARTYLFTNKNDSAEAQATAVISNSMFNLIKPLTAANYAFTKNNSEVIWQLSIPLPSSQNTADGQNFFLTGAPSPSITNCTTISPQLLSSFESGDQRRIIWVDSVIKGSNTYYFPYKYRSNNTLTITEYVTVLRLAEQYLIRAEARAQQGNTVGALADLNIIRNRAGLANYAGATDKPSLLAAILHERQVELFTEWGHRWFDLIRTGNVNAVMGGVTGVCQATKKGTWVPTAQLYPIPQAEINNDPNLTQNAGYY